MRINGGHLKGRSFYPPANKWPTRPTTDISREGLFNILQNILDFESIHMLDLFGGTGAHSYEMISRGCPKTIYVDSFKPAADFVRKTATSFGISNQIEIHIKDYKNFIKHTLLAFDYIFAGPPYPLPGIDQIPDIILGKNLLKSGGLFVLEHNQEHDFSKHARNTQVRKYGETIFSFFQ
ncbi:MAG: RsmD family RNA methyltransferase [Bacteroidota bacterium]|nr:RsmD family RNA methyltransferase [Bacteroidota bacterium]